MVHGCREYLHGALRQEPAKDIERLIDTIAALEARIVELKGGKFPEDMLPFDIRETK